MVVSLPEYANKGYGKIAVQRFIEKARHAEMKAIYLYADKENKQAIRMYEKLGFIEWTVFDKPRPKDKHLIKWLL